MAVNKDPRPVSVPSKLSVVNNTALLPSSALVRDPLVPSPLKTPHFRLLPASQKTASSTTLPKQINKEISLSKKIKSEANEKVPDKTPKLEKINTTKQRQTKEPRDENVTGNEDSATKSERNEDELITENISCTSPKRPMRSVVFAPEEYNKETNNKNSPQNEVNLNQNDEPASAGLNNRSHSFVAFERQGTNYNLGDRTSSLPLLNKQRRNSDSTLSTSNYEGDFTADGYDSDRSTVNTRIGKRFERRSNSIAELSTDKLQAIITEKIIGQLTNVQRRSSISSNQQTSLLKNYARMLQTQLKLDDIPESDSPDFSETPFMRSATKANRPDSDNEKTETGEVSGSQLWKSHLQFGSFRSTLTYSDIEGEEDMDPKVRRRLSLTSKDAAGIVTQKEKASKLAKLRIKRRESACEHDDKDEVKE